MINVKEIILMTQKIKSYRQNKKREAFKALVVVVALGLIAWGVFALMSELSKKAEEPSGEMIGDNTSAEVSDEEADGYVHVFYDIDYKVTDSGHGIDLSRGM